MATTLFEDTFTGPAGLSSDHTPETAPDGFTWQAFEGQCELDGAGSLVNVTSNSSSATTGGGWSAPLPVAFQLQLDATMTDGEDGSATWLSFYVETIGGDDFVQIELDRDASGVYSIDVETANGGTVTPFDATGSHAYIVDVDATGWRLIVDGTQLASSAEDLSAVNSVAFIIVAINVTGGLAHSAQRVAIIEADAPPPPPAVSSLPELVTPPDLCFLIAGNPIVPQSIYDDFAPMIGHDRKRKVWTYAPRVVTVAAVLDEHPAQVVDDWFENILEVGASQFTTRVAELGPNSKYWAAEWVAPPQWEAMALKRWRISGQLLLTGHGEENPPATVTLALEFALPLSGSAAIFAPVELAIEFALDLLAHNPLAFGFELGLTYAAVELREDGGRELREDGGIERRE